VCPTLKNKSRSPIMPKQRERCLPVICLDFFPEIVDYVTSSEKLKFIDEHGKFKYER
jgi:hypothetical protein